MNINDSIELYSQYILVEKGLTPVTLKNYQDDLKQFFLYYKDKTDTSELYGSDVLDYFRYMISEGKSVSTALRRLSSIRSYYSYLRKEGIICINRFKVDITGKINVLCLDKTGTLTEENLEIWDEQIIKLGTKIYEYRNF